MHLPAEDSGGKSSVDEESKLEDGPCKDDDNENILGYNEELPSSPHLKKQVRLFNPPVDRKKMRGETSAYGGFIAEHYTKSSYLRGGNCYFVVLL